MHSRDFMKTKSYTARNLVNNDDENKVPSHSKRSNDFRIQEAGQKEINICPKKSSADSLNFSCNHSLRKVIKNAQKKIFSKTLFRTKKRENLINIALLKNNKYGTTKHHRAQTVLRKINSNNTNLIDFGCQYSLNSNHSLEIISHILTQSLSQLSLIDSMFSMKRFEHKQPNVMQVFIHNLIRKFKHSNTKISRGTKKNHFLVLHGPKYYWRSSTTQTISSTRNDLKAKRKEIPLKIKDKLETRTNVRPVTRPNKICGPGEILALLKLKQSGRVHHVGVSNVNEEQLRRLNAVEKPACLQIEIHLLCQQRSLIAVAKELGIPVVAYSPLGSKALADALSAKTGREYPDLLQLPAVVKIAEAHGRTPAQILLRHLLQSGVAAIPKSTNPARIKQNISVWDFELTESEMTELSALDRGENGRICDFGFFPGIEKHPEFPFKK